MQSIVNYKESKESFKNTYSTVSNTVIKLLFVNKKTHYYRLPLLETMSKHFKVQMLYMYMQLC